jgi:hypothetical protein
VVCLTSVWVSPLWERLSFEMWFLESVLSRIPPWGWGSSTPYCKRPPVGDVVLDFHVRKVFPFGVFLKSESFSHLEDCFLMGTLFEFFLLLGLPTVAFYWD